MKDSREELASYFRTIDIMAGILVVSVIEGLLLQRWREVQFWVLVPNFTFFAVLCVVMFRRYKRYLRAYFRETRTQNPSAPWYWRLRYDPTASAQRLMWGSIALGSIVAITWILVVIAHFR
jgi:hypothetical protein